MTQAELAAAVGISQPSLANAKAGTRGFTVGYLARLAEVLRVRMEDLVTEHRRRVVRGPGPPRPSGCIGNRPLN